MDKHAQLGTGLLLAALSAGTFGGSHLLKRLAAKGGRGAGIGRGAGVLGDMWLAPILGGGALAYGLNSMDDTRGDLPDLF